MELTQSEINRYEVAIAHHLDQLDAIRHTYCEHFGIDPDESGDASDLVYSHVHHRDPMAFDDLKSEISGIESGSEMGTQIEKILRKCAKARDDIENNPSNEVAQSTLKDGWNELTKLTASVLGAEVGGDLWREVRKEMEMVVFDAVSYDQSMRILLRYRLPSTN